MDTNSVLSELRSERQRLDQAIAALEALDGSGARVQTVGKAGLAWGAKAANQKKQRGTAKMSPAARKRISEMMKKRWAARRKAAKKV